MKCAWHAAGTPDEVTDPIIELVSTAAELGYDPVAFAKIGLDYHEAIHLLAEQVAPALR